MRIIDDQISFDPGDFDGLSGFAKKALRAFVGDREDFVVLFGGLLSGQVVSAKQGLKQSARQEPVVDSLIERLAAADQKKRDDAAPRLQELLDFLGPPAIVGNARGNL